MDDSQRLNRALASRGFCSRRKADELIFAGKVKVNGVQEKNPALRVRESDVIDVDGQRLPAPQEKVYYVLNKPVHCVVTLSDPQGRKTALDFFPPEIRAKRIFPVGRLDYFSEGLLLFTNDGDFAQRLAHPSRGHEKTYEAVVREEPPEAAVREMESGMTLEDGTRLAGVKVRARKLKNGSHLLALKLRQGVNRQIRRMCAKAGLTILSLKRIQEGSLRLGNLKSGQFRPLTPEEVASLKGAENGPA